MALSRKKKQPAMPLFGVHWSQGGCGPHAQEFVTTICTWLEQPEHVEEEGVYRKSGDLSSIQKIKNSLNKSPKNLKNFLDKKDVPKSENVHIMAGLLKAYLRDLPEPIFPYELYGPSIAASCCLPQFREKMILSIIEVLPPPNRAILSALCYHFDYVTRFHTKNMMTAKNLSLVMAPNLLRPKQETIATLFGDANAAYAFVESLILYPSVYFPEEVEAPIPAFVPTPSAKRSRATVQMINWDIEKNEENESNITNLFTKNSVSSLAPDTPEKPRNKIELDTIDSSDEEKKDQDTFQRFLSKEEFPGVHTAGGLKIPVLPSIPQAGAPPGPPKQVAIQVPVQREPVATPSFPPIPSRPTTQKPSGTPAPERTRSNRTPLSSSNPTVPPLSGVPGSGSNHSKQDMDQKPASPRNYKSRVKDMLQPGKRKQKLETILSILETNSMTSLASVDQDISTLEAELSQLQKEHDSRASMGSDVNELNQNIRRTTDQLTMNREKSKIMRTHVEEMNKRLTALQNEQEAPRLIRVSARQRASLGTNIDNEDSTEKSDPKPVPESRPPRPTSPLSDSSKMNKSPSLKPATIDYASPSLRNDSSPPRTRDQTQPRRPGREVSPTRTHAPARTFERANTNERPPSPPSPRARLAQERSLQRSFSDEHSSHHESLKDRHDHPPLPTLYDPPQQPLIHPLLQTPLYPKDPPAQQPAPQKHSPPQKQKPSLSDSSERPVTSTILERKKSITTPNPVAGRGVSRDTSPTRSPSVPEDQPENSEWQVEEFEEAFESVFGAIVTYSGSTLLLESIKRGMESERGFWLAEFPSVQAVLQTWQYGAPMSLDFVNCSPLSICPDDEELNIAVHSYDSSRCVVLLMVVHLYQGRTASYWEFLPKGATL